MIEQWVSNLTPKRIVIYLVMIAVAIYVVWYVVEALEGLDPNYKPQKEGWHGGTAIKGGAEIFDPTKNTPEAMPAK